MSAAKDKGTRAETMVTEWMRHNGWPHAERHALHSSRDVGDINVGPGVVIEVKASSRITLAEWMEELQTEMDNARAAVGVVVVKRRGTQDPGRYYAVCEFADWARLCKAAGW